jgi:hypothetical protein
VKATLTSKATFGLDEVGDLQPEDKKDRVSKISTAEVHGHLSLLIPNPNLHIHQATMGKRKSTAEDKASEMDIDGDSSDDVSAPHRKIETNKTV